MQIVRLYCNPEAHVKRNNGSFWNFNAIIIFLLIVKIAADSLLVLHSGDWEYNYFLL